MVRELFALARVAPQERKVPGFRAQQWYFFFVAAFYLYIRFIKTNLTVELSSSAQTAAMFGWIIRHHTLLSFALYTAGFVSFVLRLKKGLYSYQFQQYAWTHMILMVRAEGGRRDGKHGQWLVRGRLGVCVCCCPSREHVWREKCI